MSVLTEAQMKALRWLHNRGGTGVFNKSQVLLARGELAGVMRSTWNALRDTDPPCVEFSSNPGFKRVTVTEIGQSVIKLHPGPEADTVLEDDDYA